MAKGLVGERQTGWEQRQRQREARWRTHVKGWTASGLSQAEYCRRHSLTPAEFSYWKHELVRRDREHGGSPPRGRQAAQFVPLVVTPPPAPNVDATTGSCEVLLRDGRRLCFGGGVPVQWVIELVTALERASC